jgi:hypothetical protein
MGYSEKAKELRMCKFFLITGIFRMLISGVFGTYRENIFGVFGIYARPNGQREDPFQGFRVVVYPVPMHTNSAILFWSWVRVELLHFLDTAWGQGKWHTAKKQKS